MADSKVRVSSELYEELKKIAEKSSKSMRELVDEAIRAFILGKQGVEGKEIKGITSKIIPLQYPAKCKKCGKQLNPGELAYWVKIVYTDNTVRSYIYCLDCYYKSSALKEYYLNKKKLEIIVKELKKEANELAHKVLELRDKEEFYKLANDIKSLVREVYEVLDYITDPEKEEKLRKLIEILDKLESYVRYLGDKLDKELESLKEKNKIKSKKLYKVPRRRWY